MFSYLRLKGLKVDLFFRLDRATQVGKKRRRLREQWTQDSLARRRYDGGQTKPVLAQKRVSEKATGEEGGSRTAQAPV